MPFEIDQLLARMIMVLRSRLSRRVALSVFFTIVIVEALILVPSYMNYKRDRLELLEMSGKNAALMYINTHHHDDAKHKPISSHEHLPGTILLGLTIYSKTGRELDQIGEKPLFGFSSKKSEGNTSFKPRLVGEHYEVFWQPAQLGVPYMAAARISASSLPEDLLNFILRIAGLALLISLSVCFVTMIILGRTIISPILTLRERLMHAAQNPKEVEKYVLDTERNDEIGEVFSSFNHMLYHVGDNVKTINSSLKQLRQSEARARNIFDNSNDAIFLVDMEKYLIIDANKKACQMLGYSLAELKVTSVNDIHPDEVVAVDQFSKSVLHTGSGRTDTLSCVAKDGHKIPAEISASRLEMAEGPVMMVIVRDITERKKSEEALLQMKQEADLSNRAKSEFIANISHELRTPLNSIIGFSDILQNTDYKSISADIYREYVNDINTSGQQLLDLINDILDISKIEAGKVELFEECVELHQAVEACLVMVKVRAEEANIALNCQAPEQKIILRGEARKIKQILINLLSNAIKFTDTGGQVTVSWGINNEAGVSLCVADSGIGMAAEDIPKALERFGQVQSTLTRNYEGTGLGLPLVGALTRLHDGIVDIESTPGVGTKVTVKFPAERVVSGNENPVQHIA